MRKFLIGLGLAAAVLTPFIIGIASSDSPVPAEFDDQSLAVATFAGGCFWCIEASFDEVPGVVRTVSGYTGGKFENPSYEQVSERRYRTPGERAGVLRSSPHQL